MLTTTIGTRCVRDGMIFVCIHKKEKEMSRFGSFFFLHRVYFIFDIHHDHTHSRFSLTRCRNSILSDFVAVVWIKNSVYMYKKVRALVRFLLAWHSERFCGVGGVKRKIIEAAKRKERRNTHKKVLKYHHWKILVPYTDIHKRKREKYSERKDCARWLKSESLGKYFAI